MDICRQTDCDLPAAGYHPLCVLHRDELWSKAARIRAEARVLRAQRLSFSLKAAWARRRAEGEKFRTPNEIGLRNAAAVFVRAAVRYGFLSPIAAATICVDCGNRATCYEHRDYAKPLDVDPVCHGCNMRRGKGQMPAPDKAA